MKKPLLILSILFLISSSLFAQQIDKDHSYAFFSGKYLRNQIVEGRISGFEGEVKLDMSNITASFIRIAVDLSTLNTGYSNRDTTLQGNDFLEIRKYPKLTFESTSFEVKDKGYNVSGKLCIKDKTEDVTIYFIVKNEERRMILNGSFYFNRFDFNIGKDISTISVSEDIDVKIHCIMKTK